MSKQKPTPSMWCNATIPEYLKDHFYKTFSKEIVDKARCCREAIYCRGNHHMYGIYTISEPPEEESYSYHISWYFHWEEKNNDDR